MASHRVGSLAERLITMHSFRNDYMEGAHPRVMDALVRTNAEQQIGYTEDPWCMKARTAIRRAIVDSDSKGALRKANIAGAALQVEFVCGGTMANLLCIGAALRPWECVIAAPDAHINVHETGAIEGTGHKVLTTNDADGVLTVQGIDAVMRAHEHGRNHHMVKPRMLYLSLATEFGAVFTAKQLSDLRSYADKNDLLIFIDGARLACGLASEECDLTLADVCAAADAFTVGGTKNGALFGEAIVIRNPAIQRDFKYYMKQRGAILAKGRLLGVQFATLFDTAGTAAGIEEAQGDEAMYFSMGRHSVEAATRLKDVLVRHGYDTFASNSSTNQLFLLLDNDTADDFIRAFDADLTARPDAAHTIVRMTCSWATTQNDIDEVDRMLAGATNEA